MDMPKKFLRHHMCWFLPIFGVYHPKKLDKIRVVFDSAAKYEGVCLNDTLLTNNLVGVLLRVRSKRIALTADLQLSGT